MADGTTIGKAYVQIVPSAKGFTQSLSQQFEGGSSKLAGVGTKAGAKVGESTGKSLVSKLKGIIAAAGIGTVLVKGIKAALDEGARYEQSVGGIETLFGAGGAKSVQEYAKSVGKSVKEVKGKYKELTEAQNIAMKNASQSYKTAGLSASEYMDTITSFAAALKSSTKNEVEAAKVGNMAVVDMADNANKMGTDMESIQNAYQGFAKQNYTMLDNLKLGFAGSKSGMQELLKKAQELTGVKYDINNLSDVYNAIHAIQTNLGITGTTAREAASTMSGSFNMFKASLKDLGAQLATGGDVGGAMKNVVSSTITMLKNAIPMILNIVKGAVTGIVQYFQANGPQILSAIQNGINTARQWIATNVPQILNNIGDTISAAIPKIFARFNNGFGPALQAGVTLLSKVGEGMLNGLKTVLSKLPGIVGKIVSGISQFVATNGPKVIEAGFTLLNNITKGIGKAVPMILQTIPKIINQMTHKFLETDWDAVGKKMMKAINTGVDNMGKNLPETLKKIGKAAANGFKNIDWKAVGKTVLTILKLSLEVGGTLLLAVGKQLGKAVISGLKLAWKGIKEVGSNLVKGLWNGIKDMAGWIKSKIQGFGKGVLDTLKSFFGIHSPSKVMHDQIGVMIGRGLAAGIDASTETAKKSAKSQGSAILAAYKKNLSDYKSTHDMSIADEVRYWQEIRAKAKQGSTIYNEVTTLYKTAAKKMKDERAKNIASAKKDYKSAAKEIVSDYKSTVKELIDQQKSIVSERKESIAGQFNPFQKWSPEKSEMSSGEILQNIKDFRASQAEWDQVMADLKSRVGDGKLYDYMSALGPTYVNQVKELLTLSPDDLKSYADMWHAMRVDAGNEAREEMSSELQALQTQIEQAGTKAQEKLNSLSEKFKTTVKGFGGTLKDAKPTISQYSKDLGNAITTNLKTTIKTGPIKSKVQSVAKSVKSTKGDFTATAQAIGNAFVDALVQAIKNGASAVNSAASSLAATANSNASNVGKASSTSTTTNTTNNSSTTINITEAGNARQTASQVSAALAQQNARARAAAGIA